MIRPTTLQHTSPHSVFRDILWQPELSSAENVYIITENFVGTINVFYIL
jgi:hypothetical protein